MDIKTLVFRVQSDFGNAQSNVDSFIESFRKLDTVGQDFGARIKASIDTAFRGGGEVQIDPEKLLPVRAIVQGSKEMSSALTGLYNNLLKTEESLQSAFEKPTAAISQDIEFIKRLESQIEGTIQTLSGLPKALAEAHDTGGESGLVQKYEEIVPKISAAVEHIKEQLATLGQQSEVKVAAGLDKLPEIANAADAAIKKVEDQLSGLKDKLAQMQGNFLAEAFNPKGIESLSNAIPQLEGKMAKLREEFAKTAESMSKLGVGSSPQEIAKLTEQMKKLEDQSGKMGIAMSTAAKQAEGGGIYSRLGQVLGGLNFQTAALAVGFIGWFTVIQSGVNVIRDVVNEGMHMQESMVQLGNASGLAKEQVAGVFEALRGVSTDTGVGLDTLVAGFRAVSREGFSVADSQKILKEATRDNLAFMADEGTMATNLARILHDWGAGAEQAAGFNEMLAQSAIRGNTSIETFSTNYAKASTIAKQFGISQNELAGDLATISQRTGDTTSAGNQLALMFTRLTENSTKVQTAVAAINPALAGAFSPQALASAGGMQRALEIISKIAPQNPDVWKAAFGIFSSTDQAINLTAGDLQDLKKNTDEAGLAASGVLTPAMTGATKQLGTTEQQVRILDQRWTDLKRSFGTAVALPVATDLVKTAQLLGQTFSDLGGMWSHFIQGDLKKGAEDGKNYIGDLVGLIFDPGKALRGKAPSGLKEEDFPKPPQNLHKLGDTIGPWVDDLKKSTEGVNDPQQAAMDVTTKIASAITTITKGVEDAMKLLAEAQHFNLPDNIDQLITPIAGMMKKVYDTVANAFQNTPSFTAKNNDEIVKFITDSIKAMDDVIKLLNDLPTANLSDQSGKIDTLAKDLVDIQKRMQKAFDDTGQAAHAGETALTGEISKSIGSEVTALKDVAGLYKEMQGVSFGTPDSTIKLLADKAAMIGKMMGPILSDLGVIPEQLGKAAELVAHEATTLKDIAGLYKEMDGVNFGTPDSVIKLLADKSGLIARLMGPILSAIGEVPDAMSKAAELVGHEATALKDVAGVYKEMDGVNLGQPDSSFQRLADTAGKIHSLLGPILQSVTGDPEKLSKVAELLGREATALKDVAGLYKEMDGVSLSQPDASFAQLARTAGVIHEDIVGLLQSVTGNPEAMSKVAELLGREATALKDTASLLKEMTGVDFNTDPTEGVSKLVDVLQHTNDILGPYLAAQGGKDYSKAAESAGRIVTAVKDTASLLKELQTLDSFDNSRVKSQIDQIIEVLNSTIQYFDDNLVKLANNPDVVGKIAQDAGSVMKSVGDAVKVIEDLQTLPSLDTGKLKSQIDQVIRIMNDALSYFDEQMVELKNTSKVGATAKDAGDLMKALGDAVKVIENLEVLPHIDEDGIKQAIDGVIRIMDSALSYFDQQVVELKNGSKLPAVAKDAAEVMKAVDDTLKVFETLASKKGLYNDPRAIAQAIDTAIAAVKYFISGIEQSGLDAGEVAKAGLFAENMSKIFEAIDKVEKASEKASGKGGGASFGNIGPNLQNLRNAVNGMLHAGGGSDNMAMTGINMLNPNKTGNQNGFFGSPQIPQIPMPQFPTSQFLSGLQHGGFLIPPTPGPDHNPPMPKGDKPPHVTLPAQTPKGHKDEAPPESVLNVDIVMDGDVLARSLNNKMRSNQTLRTNLVPSHAGAR